MKSALGRAALRSGQTRARRFCMRVFQMDIKTAVTEGPVADFAAVRVKIAQSGPTVGADLVGILAAGISEGVARVLHQHDFARSGFHSS